jgi:ABC-type sugar transport system substrate-binding protein
MKRKSRFAIVAMVALASVGLVAGTQGPAIAQESGPAAAKASVKKLLVRPTKIPSTTPIKGTVPADNSLSWMECGIPDCATLGAPLQQAADYFGWDMETVDIGLTPEEVKAGWQRAVRAEPDSVVATGFPRVIFDTELAELAANDTKVIDGFMADPAGNGITATYSGISTSRAIGSAFADWVTSEKGSDANVLFVTSSTFPTLVNVTEGFEARYKKVCPKCEQDKLDVPATAIGGDLPEQIVAELRSNPDINYVVVDEGNMMIGLPQAMQAAGINDVPVTGQYPSETTLEYLKTGTIVKAIVMTQQADAMWQAADVLARSLAGDTFLPDQPKSAVWIVTPKTAGTLKAPYAVVADYQKQYKKLWSAAKS